MNETWYSDRGLWGEVQNARTITLSSVFMELFPFLIFAILNFSGAYLWKYKRESNETCYLHDTTFASNCNCYTTQAYYTSAGFDLFFNPFIWETHKRVIGKQGRPRSDAAEHGFWSRSPLFENGLAIFLLENLNHIAWHI